MCVRVAIDLGLFEMIVERDPGKGGITAKGLAVRSQAEKLLIGNLSSSLTSLLLYTDRLDGSQSA